MNQAAIQIRHRALIFRLGFLLVLVSLSLLLFFQYRWQQNLQESSAIARRASLKNYLEAVITEVEFHYRATAERLLNLSPELFTEGNLQKAAKYWARWEADGLSRLFVVDFTQSEHGNYLFLDPDTMALVSPPASDESLAVIVACSPWRLRYSRASGAIGQQLRVDETDLDHRIVFRVITDEWSNLVGIAGMILDRDYFAGDLLPAIIAKQSEAFFGGGRGGNFGIRVRSDSGEIMLDLPEGHEGDLELSRALGFVFSGWTLSLRHQGSSPEEWARTNFLFNLLLSLLLALVLLAGIGLSLRTANRSMRLSEMKSDFVSNVSHELRTPLASIRVFAEFLRAGRAEESGKVREYGATIEAESRRLSRLIDNILDFSRIESGRKTYKMASTNLEELLRESVETFRLRPAAREFEIDFRGPASELPRLAIDADAIGRAFDNLLDNAVKYSQEDRRVSISLSRDGDCVLIAVADRGVGIPKAEQSRIFDRFHRVGRGLVHDVKGSGLGLAIVDHVVRAHGGSVSVQSEPGKGSRFTLRLPLAAAHGLADEARGS